MTTNSNHYRKVRALVAKTTDNGCTPAEHVSATNLAVSIIKTHGLDAARIAWPEPPRGFMWRGDVGRSEVVEDPTPELDDAPAEKPKRTRATKAKPRRERKPKTPAEHKAPRVTNGERLAEMAARPEGFTLAEVIETFGILPHTARALISIELRKKRGLTVAYDKAAKVYRATAA